MVGTDTAPIVATNSTSTSVYYCPQFQVASPSEINATSPPSAESTAPLVLNLQKASAIAAWQAWRAHGVSLDANDQVALKHVHPDWYIHDLALRSHVGEVLWPQIRDTGTILERSTDCTAVFLYSPSDRPPTWAQSQHFIRHQFLSRFVSEAASNPSHPVAAALGSLQESFNIICYYQGLEQESRIINSGQPDGHLKPANATNIIEPSVDQAAFMLRDITSARPSVAPETPQQPLPICGPSSLSTFAASSRPLASPSPPSSPTSSNGSDSDKGPASFHQPASKFNSNCQTCGPTRFTNQRLSFEAEIHLIKYFAISAVELLLLRLMAYEESRGTWELWMRTNLVGSRLLSGEEAKVQVRLEEVMTVLEGGIVTSPFGLCL